jgi:hypothetical protein
VFTASVVPGGGSTDGACPCCASYRWLISV